MSPAEGVAKDPVGRVRQEMPAYAGMTIRVGLGLGLERGEGIPLPHFFSSVWSRKNGAMALFFPQKLRVLCKFLVSTRFLPDWGVFR